MHFLNTCREEQQQLLKGCTATCCLHIFPPPAAILILFSYIIYHISLYIFLFRYNFHQLLIYHMSYFFIYFIFPPQSSSSPHLLIILYLKIWVLENVWKPNLFLMTCSLTDGIKIFNVMVPLYFVWNSSVNFLVKVSSYNSSMKFSFCE